MRKASKFIYYFLKIITFNQITKYWAKKYNKVNTTFITSDKIPFSLEDLINLLGKDNVANIKNTLSRVQITLNNSKNLDLNKIKELNGISGVVLSQNTLNLIVGNNASTIALQLKEKVLNNG
ncbi:PTS glucose transporter subunit IIB [Mesomycoplasma hyorhinis]|uniref:PTS glucose transporter subunit IIB n=1 Tax=Mesomycoplasma hyorhinis TaxID=2100 RepID=UPI00136A9C2C|nr:PTS glucose transporter subunit IIB [Mesomycoplasma hyorhinis]MXR57902.1 PTS glucose transporter subunit IIB [Mesomycoplasma hyorhinis]